MEVYTEINVTERLGLRQRHPSSPERIQPKTQFSGIEFLPKRYKTVNCIYRATNEPIAADRCWGSSSPLSSSCCYRLPAARHKRPGGTNSMTLPWGDRQGKTTLGLSFRRVRVKSSFASLLSKELFHTDFTEFGETRWAREYPARCSAASIAQLLVFWLGIIRVDGLAFWHSFAWSPDESTSQYTSGSYVLQSQWCERMWGLRALLAVTS